MQNEVLDHCVQLHGGYGFMNEYRVARAWRDARVSKIWAGSNEIMKELIGRDLGPCDERRLAFLARALRADKDRPMSSDPGPVDVQAGPHEDEPHEGGIGNRLNWLRAGVLGANDGIVSTAGIVVGVAGATSDRTSILVAGVAGLAAGALSMGAGEYVSVSTQRDSEHALLEKERRELEEEPEEELAELAGIYVGKGLSEDLAMEVARQLTEHDALGAHAEAELNIDPDDLTNPWHAAWASMVSFTVGALLPLLTIVLVATGRAGPGHRGRRGRGPRPHRVDEREVRLRLGPGGGAAQRRRRPVRDGGHLSHRRGHRHPDRLSWAWPCVELGRPRLSWA